LDYLYRSVAGGWQGVFVVTTIGDHFRAIAEFRECSFNRVCLWVAVPLRDRN
jgi:hypothetical protein